MTFLLERIMEFSIYGIVWISLLFLAGKCFTKKAGVRWQYFISLCIVLHLLIPVHIQWFSLDFSQFFCFENDFLQNTVSEKMMLEHADVETPERKQGTDIAAAAENVMMQKESERTQNFASEVSDSQNEILKEKQKGYADYAGKEQILPRFSCLEVLAMVWIAGMFLCFGGQVLSYAVFRRRVKKYSVLAEAKAHAVFEKVREQYGVRKNIVLRRSAEVASPMLIGLVKPVILLPDTDYEEVEYRYIFAHELCHYRHGDILVKYIFAVCRGVYWFHPLVHMLYRRVSWQMEYLCDEAVVRGKGLEEKRAYSMVLLKHILSAGCSKTVPLSAGFYGRKDCMKMRFQNIMNGKKRRVEIGAVIVAVAAVLLFGGVKLGNANNVKMQDDKNGITKEEENFVVGNKKILLVGTDSSPAEAADARVLFDVNGEEDRITVEQIPRELKVDLTQVAEVAKGKKRKQLAESGEGRLSTAYFYGKDVLAAAVEQVYRVKIDSVVIVNYKAVQRMVDMAGGVEVTLTEKEANYLNITNYISDRKNRTVTAGSQILNGDQAVGYMRIRRIEAGSPVVDEKETKEKDTFARLSRCDNVLYALANRLKEKKADWKKIVAAFLEGKAKSEISVDISKEEVFALMEKLISGDFTLEKAGERNMYQNKVIPAVI